MLLEMDLLSGVDQLLIALAQAPAFSYVTQHLEAVVQWDFAMEELLLDVA